MFFSGKFWTVMFRVVAGTAAVATTATVTHKIADKGTEASIRAVKWIFKSKEEQELEKQIEQEMRARIRADIEARRKSS